MASSTQSLRASLYHEHLEEASALYEQRTALQSDPELTWLGIASFEERLDAHLDALVIGGQQALDICRVRAITGDPGELFAAVCIFCRRMHTGALADVLQSLDYTVAPRTSALRDALKYELPFEWRDHCARALAGGSTNQVPTLAEVLGYRRLATGEVLTRSLAHASPGHLPPLLWSLGRTADRTALPAVRAFLNSEDPSIAAAAFDAALRLDDGRALSSLMAIADGGGTQSIGLGLAGGPNVAPALLARLDDSRQGIISIRALALLGDLSTIRSLVAALSVENLAEAAADALYVITGAPLVGDVIVPQVIAEDEMFSHEVAAFNATGALPLRPDGELFVTRIRCLTRDPEIWREWLAANASRFERGHRYRFGQLYTPRVLLDCLRSETFPKAYRSWVAEELLIRYGIDLPFESDMFVADQLRILSNAMPMVDRVTTEVEPGQWYFAGELIS